MYKRQLFGQIYKHHVDLNTDTVFTNGYSPIYLNAVLEQDNYVLMDDSSAVKVYPQFKNCRVITVPQTYMLNPIAFGYQKNSSLTALFDYFINRMFEKGAFDRIFRRWHMKDPDCKPRPGKDVKATPEKKQTNQNFLSGQALGLSLIHI